MRFDGKVAVVTGGASGIGRAAAEILAARGAAVAVLDCADETGEEAVAAIRGAHHARTLFRRVNIAAPHEVEAAVEFVRRSLGPIDILVASAGVQRYGTALTTSDEQWAEVIGVNLSGAWYAARACLPDMIGGRGEGGGSGGAIVNIASVQALASQRNVFAYATSKHAMIGLTRSMAMDFAADGVRVNAVCPGTVDTPMLRWTASLDPDPPSVLADCARMHPAGRIARPEEIGEVVAFLAHESASFVTGAVWTVDGGLLTLIGGTPRTGAE